MADSRLISNVKSKVKGIDKIEKYIVKATKNKITVPQKLKHIQGIVSHSWYHQGGSVIFGEIFKRPLAEKEVTLFKALIIIHRLTKDGHDQVLVDGYLRSSFFSNLRSAYRSSPTEYGQFNASMLNFIIAKFKYHHDNISITGNISLEKFTSNAWPKFSGEQAIQTCADTMVLQKACLTICKRLISEKIFVEVKFNCAAELITESYSLYILTIWIIRQLVLQIKDRSRIQPLIDTFYEQYPQLVKLYATANGVYYIKSLIGVPLLPNEVPEFFEDSIEELPDKIEEEVIVKPKKKKHARKKSRSNDSMNPFSDVNNPFFNGNASAYQAPPPTLVFQQSPAAANLNVIGQNIFGNSPRTNRKAHDLFNDLLSSTQIQEDSESSEEEIDNDAIMRLRERIAELEKNITGLRSTLGNLEEQNRDLNANLKNREGGLSNVRQNMQSKLEEQKVQFLEANSHLKSHLTTVMNRYEQEKLNLLEDQIAFSQRSLSSHLLKFDDPNYAGNRYATGSDIIECADSLSERFKKMILSLQQEVLFHCLYY
eukprot:TRINITY_DN1023_c0_g1_i2.p1 TRINITY_DN1023_c0_g1~~TRINITY_DN1023_c0_g1_i2.p1  ORF type:complete len:540 (+),score=83.45 TRINITY_DN1023_c0_g1_i2:322-1941(+)